MPMLINTSRTRAIIARPPRWPFTVNWSSVQAHHLAVWCPLVMPGMVGIGMDLVAIDGLGALLANGSTPPRIANEAGRGAYTDFAASGYYERTGYSGWDSGDVPGITIMGNMLPRDMTVLHHIGGIGQGGGTNSHRLVHRGDLAGDPIWLQAATASVTGTVTTVANRWYHACGRNDKTTLELYIDGASDTTGGGASSWSTYGLVRIGAIPRGATASNLFDGGLSDFRLYKTADKGLIDEIVRRASDPGLRWDLAYELGRRAYFFPAAAGGSLTTALDTLDAAGHGPALGHGTALDTLDAAGLPATLGAGGSLTTALDTLDAAGHGPALGHGTALDTLDAVGLPATLSATGELTTNLATLATAGHGAALGHGTALASLDAAGRAAALGIVGALGALSRAERAQALGLITSSAPRTLTEFPVSFGGAGFTTHLASLAAAGQAAGLTLWQLGDALAATYGDLEHFLAVDMGFGEPVTSGAATLEGIFDDHSAAGGTLDGPALRLATADVDAHAIDQGSVLVIRGRTFHVAGVQRDGTGLAYLVLSEPS